MQILNPFDGQTYEVAKGLMSANGPVTHKRMVATPKGFTGASQDGLKLHHVRGKNTAPRPNASRHYTNSGASERRVSSLKAAK